MAIPEIDFSSAKSALSSLMDEVVHQRQPHLVQRHKGRETMLLVRPDDLARWLETFRFSVAVTFGEGDAAVEWEGFGVVGVGEDLHAAMEDLVVELRAYARRFFEQSQFYAQTDRARHYPWLLRFALTPPDAQLELLYADADAAAANQRPGITASAE
jgi:antitoxin of RelE/RelB toxin-antitoxin system